MFLSIPNNYSIGYQHNIMFISLSVVFGLVLVSIGLFFVERLRSRMAKFEKLIGHLPHPETNPLFGNFLDLFRMGAYAKAFDQYIPKYGDIFSFYGFTPEVVLSHPDYIRQMYLSSNERGTDIIQPILDTIQINGLFTMEHSDKWKFHRRLISPIFQASNLQKTDWIMIEKIQKLQNRWKNLAAANGGQIELQSLTEFQNLTVDAIGHAAFGYDFNSISGNNSTLLRAFDLLLNNAGERIKYGIIPYWRWFPFLPINAQLKKARELAQSTITKMIETKIDTYREQKSAGTLSEDRLDLMDLLLRASQENDDGKFSTDDLYAEAFTFVVAGNETTAISLTFLFNLLGNNLTEQQKLRDAIKSAIGDKTPTMKELNEIPYLEMCIKESMRVFPVAYVNRREALEDMKIGNYTVLKGTSLVYSAQFIHNDERFWIEPKKFNPERFSREEEEKRPLHSFIPFGGGLRICVGKTFAMTEMKYATAMLVRDFEIDSRKFGVTGTSEQFVLRPDSPCPFIVKPLQH